MSKITRLDISNTYAAELPHSFLVQVFQYKYMYCIHVRSKLLTKQFQHVCLVYTVWRSCNNTPLLVPSTAD